MRLRYRGGGHQKRLPSTRRTAQGDVGNPDAGLGGLANDAAEGTAYTVTIKHDGTNATAEIGDPTMAAEDDPKFIDQEADLDGGRTMARSHEGSG